MVGVWRRLVDWFRYVWGREFVVFMLCVFGFLGNVLMMDFLKFIYMSLYVDFKFV